MICAAGSDGYWAHALWQRHGLHPEEYDAMPRKMKLFYIASELVVDDERKQAKIVAEAQRNMRR